MADNNKADILLHPVRMKIVQALMSNSKYGVTPLGMADMIKDVPQATLYRHIQKLSDADIIRVLKEEKVHSVTERYYVLNMEKAQIDKEEWENYTASDKLSYYSHYQLSLFGQYKNYLTQLENNQNASDASSFTIAEFKLDDKSFHDFQKELETLMVKYYNKSNENKKQDETKRTIGFTIIP